MLDGGNVRMFSNRGTSVGFCYGYEFEGWNGDCEIANSLYFVLTDFRMQGGGPFSFVYLLGNLEFVG